MTYARPFLPVALVAAVALSACVPVTTGTVINTPGVPEALVAADEQLCLQAVARQTANSVRILDTQAFPGETTVYVGVGSQNTQFVCRVLNGRVSAITAV
jgi:purine nucleoside phosphorylase